MNAIIDFEQNDIGEIISIEAKLPIRILKKERYWTVYSPHLKTLGYSRKSKEDALRDFDRAVTIFFTVHQIRESLFDALEKLNWTRKISNNSKLVGRKHFKVPHNLLGDQKPQSHQVSVALA